MKVINCKLDIGRILGSVVLGAALALTPAVPAQATISIATVPLSVTSAVDPNIMFILDDSGSMQWEIMPDDFIYSYFTYPRPAGIYGAGDYTNYVVDFAAANPYSAVARSNQVNAVYYNPAITYRPWKNSDNTDFPAAPITCAPHNPMNTGLGCRDLTANNTQSARWENCTSQWACTTSGNESRTFWPALYYVYNGGGLWNTANYTRIEIRSTTPTYTGSANRSDCAAAPTCTYAEEIQNFANWYTYYRSRILAARGGVGRAFAEQSEGMRVGFGALNSGGATIDSVWSARSIIRGVRKFTGTDRQTFFSDLYNHPIPTSGTPLRRALEAAGEYSRRTDNRGPWGAVPGTNDGSAHLQCRQSYSILMTDGYWNGGDPTVSGIDNTNVDNQNGPTHVNHLPNGTNSGYTAADPYRDGHSETLADVAMYYWKNDLRTDLNNRVPVNTNDNAFWQHMVTFGVGLGVTGTITPSDAWAAVQSGTAIAWPDPSATNPAKIDDLLHAGVNSHGGFFSAADPDTFATELSLVLQDIVSRVESSATAAATSSSVLKTDTLVYTAGYRSNDWSGQFIAETIDDPLLNLRTTQWNAETQLRLITPASRNIFTRNDSTGGGVSLVLGDLSAAQQVALNRDLTGGVDGLGANRINWLRGDEAAHASFRNRSASGQSRLLGDVVHSNPQFEGKRDYGYSLISGLTSSYNTFRSTAPYTTRPDVLYVGANDGMLHAFNAANGNELFAYMPSELLAPEGAPGFARINRLMDPNYQHRYFVDGTVALGDAQISGSWKTVLVGTMGQGGRTVFALDITNPNSFSGANVLWEFTDPDLGYGVGQPIIARMRDGSWVAIFGNGYNSDNHRGMIFVVDLTTGLALAKIDTGVGSAASPNGIKDVNVTDWPALDLAARYIYAGDLQGNVWRLDVNTPIPNEWDDSSRRTNLFQAVDPIGTQQPITTRLALAANSNDPNTTMVLFGTGSYFRTGDKVLTSPQIQSVYGLIDDYGTVINSRSDLVQQTVTWQGANPTSGERVREISDNPILGVHKGWYLDLAYSGIAEGERVNSGFSFPAGIIQEEVRFRTLIPNDDACDPGSSGFIYQFLASSGGRTQDSVFDLNNDGNIDGLDEVGNRIINARELPDGVGEGDITSIRIGDTNKDLLIGVGFGTNNAGPAGRQSWRQYR